MIFYKNSNKPISEIDKELLTFFDDCSSSELLLNKIENKKFKLHRTSEKN